MIVAAPTHVCLAYCYLTVELMSLNKFTGGHWAGKTKHWRHTKDKWIPLLRTSEGLGIPVPHENRKRRVLVHRWLGKGQRKWDERNFHGGSVKCVEDALVRLGWLKDDAPKWVEMNLKQRHASELSKSEQEWWQQRKIRTVVAVYEMPNG